ncbi:MAG: 2-amino-4-hydroxy-6-hydroxymethyldihydropteridine diphosphokinase [Mycobacterium sp.]|nr:2-amino-4-hydroxy-6-hydroxymethyldihydropteridine diphosphokinase [Mycobacterium sp.]
MSRCVLSIGSNLGDRLGRLQAVVDALGDSVLAVSPVFETDAWGGVEQEPFLNAVVIADDPASDAWDWLRRAQWIENDNERVRTLKWGPRTLDVDLVCCFAGEGGAEAFSDTEELTLPHPLAHQRAFVLIPWLAVDADAQLSVARRSRPVRQLVDELDPDERAGVRPTNLLLNFPLTPPTGSR